MGRFDDLTADLQPATSPNGGGRFDDLLRDLPPSDPSLADRFGSAMKSLSPALPGGGGAVSTISELYDPAKKIHAAFPKVAGDISEYLGEKGVNPKIAASATLPIAIAPEIVSAGMGLNEIANGTSNFSKAVRNTPKDLGEQYAAQNEVAKISGELPVRSGKLPGYPKSSADLGDLNTAKNMMLNPPNSYPKDPAAIINLAKNRIEAFGSDLTNQELNDYDSMLGNMIKLGRNTVEKIAGKGAWGVLGETQGKVADLLSKGITAAIDKVPYWPENYEPSREQLDQVYALSKKLRVAPEVAKKIWSYLGPKLRWGMIGVP